MMKHNQVVFEEQENQCYQEKYSRVPGTAAELGGCRGLKAFGVDPLTFE